MWTAAPVDNLRTCEPLSKSTSPLTTCTSVSPSVTPTLNSVPKSIISPVGETTLNPRAGRGTSARTAPSDNVSCMGESIENVASPPMTNSTPLNNSACTVPERKCNVPVGNKSPSDNTTSSNFASDCPTNTANPKALRSFDPSVAPEIATFDASSPRGQTHTHVAMMDAAMDATTAITGQPLRMRVGRRSASVTPIDPNSSAAIERRFKSNSTRSI